MLMKANEIPEEMRNSFGITESGNSGPRKKKIKQSRNAYYAAWHTADIESLRYISILQHHFATLVMYNPNQGGGKRLAPLVNGRKQVRVREGTAAPM